MPRPLVFSILLLLLPGMAAEVAGQADATPPAIVLGTFEDDYGALYEITDTTWTHGSSRYRIEAWHPDERFLLLTSERDSAGSDPVREWLRIDWVLFDRTGETPEGPESWAWGYCMAVWTATSAAEARGVPTSDRDAPRVGCGDGFPFTRMQPIERFIEK